jgi:hypothetical protein
VIEELNEQILLNEPENCDKKLVKILQDYSEGVEKEMSNAYMKQLDLGFLVSDEMVEDAVHVFKGRMTKLTKEQLIEHYASNSGIANF